jgi:hypothetical protein
MRYKPRIPAQQRLNSLRGSQAKLLIALYKFPEVKPVKFTKLAWKQMNEAKEYIEQAMSSLAIATNTLRDLSKRYDN